MNYKIAIIEDEPDCYENYSAVLNDRGFRTETFIDADTVISNLAKICTFDLIILDLMMQLGTKINSNEASETGIAIYKRIREINKKVPILIITAKSFTDIDQEFKGDNNVLYIGKPLTDPNLLEKYILRML